MTYEKRRDRLNPRSLGSARPSVDRLMAYSFACATEFISVVASLTRNAQSDLTEAGGYIFKKDDPQAEVHILDAGHFALDLKSKETIDLTLHFINLGFAKRTYYQHAGISMIMD